MVKPVKASHRRRLRKNSGKLSNTNITAKTTKPGYYGGLLWLNRLMAERHPGSNLAGESRFIFHVCNCFLDYDNSNTSNFRQIKILQYKQYKNAKVLDNLRHFLI